MYACCPIIWASKMQTHVTMLTIMAEYLALSMLLRDVILLMELLNELKDHRVKLVSTEPKVYCKAFKDNAGTLEIA